MKALSCSSCGGRIESQASKSFCSHCGTAYVADTPFVITPNVKVDVQVSQTCAATEYLALNQKVANLVGSIKSIEEGPATPDIPSEGMATGIGCFGLIVILIPCSLFLQFLQKTFRLANDNTFMGLGSFFSLILGSFVFFKIYQSVSSPKKKKIKELNAELATTKQRLSQLNY